MSKDYREILSGKVEEVKDEVDDLEDPDFEKLLKLEREGKDRKTVKEYLKDLKGESEEETEETKDDVEETTEDVEPYLGSSDGGIMDRLESLSPASLLGLGLIIGVIAGAGAAHLTTGSAYSESPDVVKSDMQSLLSGPNRTVETGPAMKRNGMYYFNASTTQETENGTQTRYRQFYVSSDGELLFPKLEVPLLGLRTPVNLEEAMSQREAREGSQ